MRVTRATWSSAASGSKLTVACAASVPLAPADPVDAEAEGGPVSLKCPTGSEQAAQDSANQPQRAFPTVERRRERTCTAPPRPQHVAGCERTLRLSRPSSMRSTRAGEGPRRKPHRAREARLQLRR